MKIINNHIPRTIFGVKYNFKYDKVLMLNVLVLRDDKGNFLTHNDQIKFINKLKKDVTVSGIKPLKWLIKP